MTMSMSQTGIIVMAILFIPKEIFNFGIQ